MARVPLKRECSKNCLESDQKHKHEHITCSQLKGLPRHLAVGELAKDLHVDDLRYIFR